MDNEGQREDYYVRARFALDDLVVENVPCKVYLPKLPGGRPRAVLAPSVAQAEALSHSPKAAFAADVVHFGATEVSLRGTAFFESLTSTYWGPDLTQCSATLDFDDLHVLTTRSNHDLPPSLQLELCGDTLLMPGGLVGTSFDGSASYTPISAPSLTLRDGMVLTFRRHFVDLPAPEGEHRRTSYLVADCAPAVDVTSPERVLKVVSGSVDELLAIASCGARRRAACVGWFGAHGSRTSRFFRGGIARPEKVPQQTIHDALIPMSHYIGFVQHGYNRLVAAGASLGLLNCAYALAGRQRSLEARYLSLFAAFEGLILAHRQASGTDILVRWDSPQWRALCRVVKAAVKRCGILDSDRRSLLYDKLPELNRVSLAKAARSFLESHRVQVDDLWPMFQPGGLDRIRNWLIHGSFPEQLVSELYTASDHLQWLVERSVLAVLGWDLTKSYVSSSALRAMRSSSYDSWALHCANVKSLRVD